MVLGCVGGKCPAVVWVHLAFRWLAATLQHGGHPGPQARERHSRGVPLVADGRGRWAAGAHGAAAGRQLQDPGGLPRHRRPGGRQAPLVLRLGLQRHRAVPPRGQHVAPAVHALLPCKGRVVHLGRGAKGLRV